MRWIVDVPAQIVTLWFVAYEGLLLVATIGCVTMVTAMLALAAVGVRWGW